jgi:hypothetical protein
MSSPNEKRARVEALEARVEELADMEKRARDGQKMAYGALIGFAGLLIAFAWYGGHESYKRDIAEIRAELKTTNDQGFDQFVKKLEAEAGTRNNDFAQQMRAMEQRLNVRVQARGGISATNIQEINAEITQQVTGMIQLWERHTGGVLGWACFDRSIASISSKTNRDFPTATEFFLRAGLFFARSGEEAILQTTLSHLTTYCWKSLRARDFVMRPMIDRYYLELVSELEKANVNGRYEVALRELQRGYTAAKQRK